MLVAHEMGYARQAHTALAPTAIGEGPSRGPNNRAAGSFAATEMSISARSRPSVVTLEWKAELDERLRKSCPGPRIRSPKHGSNHDDFVVPRRLPPCKRHDRSRQRVALGFFVYSGSSSKMDLDGPALPPSWQLVLGDPAYTGPRDR